jgi:hypothetical protein
MIKFISFNKIQYLKIAIFLTLCLEVTSVPLDISFSIFGNIFGFIILFFSLWKNLRYSIPALTLSLILFFFYFFINTGFYINSSDPYKALYYCLIAIILSVEFHQINFVNILEDVFFKYLLLIVPLFFIGIGIDDAGGTSRIQGLMSEPSALSLILNFLLWTYLTRKNYKKLTLVILVCLLTFSLVVYAQIILFYLLRLFFDRKFKSFFKLILIGVTTLFILISFQNIESENWLINKISSAVNHTLSGGTEGKNSRSVDISRLIDEQNRNDLSYWIGNGPNYGVYYYSSREMLTNTQNMPSIFFFNFGIFGFIIGLFWIFYALNKLRKSIYYFLLLSSVSYSLINTASGIVNDIYLFTLLFYSSSLLFNLKSNNLKKKIIINESK